MKQLIQDQINLLIDTLFDTAAKTSLEGVEEQRPEVESIQGLREMGRSVVLGLPRLMASLISEEVWVRHRAALILVELAPSYTSFTEQGLFDEEEPLLFLQTFFQLLIEHLSTQKRIWKTSEELKLQGLIIPESSAMRDRVASFLENLSSKDEPSLHAGFLDLFEASHHFQDLSPVGFQEYILDFQEKRKARHSRELFRLSDQAVEEILKSRMTVLPLASASRLRLAAACLLRRLLFGRLLLESRERSILKSEVLRLRKIMLDTLHEDASYFPETDDELHDWLRAELEKGIQLRERIRSAFQQMKRSWLSPLELDVAAEKTVLGGFEPPPLGIPQEPPAEEDDWDVASEQTRLPPPRTTGAPPPAPMMPPAPSPFGQPDELELPGAPTPWQEPYMPGGPPVPPAPPRAPIPPQAPIPPGELPSDEEPEFPPMPSFPEPSTSVPPPMPGPSAPPAPAPVPEAPPMPPPYSFSTPSAPVPLEPTPVEPEEPDMGEIDPDLFETVQKIDERVPPIAGELTPDLSDELGDDDDGWAGVGSAAPVPQASQPSGVSYGYAPSTVEEDEEEDFDDFDKSVLVPEKPEVLEKEEVAAEDFYFEEVVEPEPILESALDDFDDLEGELYSESVQMEFDEKLKEVREEEDVLFGKVEEKPVPELAKKRDMDGIPIEPELPAAERSVVEEVAEAPKIPEPPKPKPVVQDESKKKETLQIDYSRSEYDLETSIQAPRRRSAPQVSLGFPEKAKASKKSSGILQILTLPFKLAGFVLILPFVGAFFLMKSVLVIFATIFSLIGSLFTDLRELLFGSLSGLRERLRKQAAEAGIGVFELFLSDEAGRPGPIERTFAQSMTFLRMMQATIGLYFIVVVSLLDALLAMFTVWIHGIFLGWKAFLTVRKRARQQFLRNQCYELADELMVSRLRLSRLFTFVGFYLEEAEDTLPQVEKWQELTGKTFPLRLTLDIRNHLDDMRRDLSLLTKAQAAQAARGSVVSFLVGFIPNPLSVLVSWKDIFVLTFFMKYSRDDIEKMYLDMFEVYRHTIEGLQEKNFLEQGHIALEKLEPYHTETMCHEEDMLSRCDEERYEGFTQLNQCANKNRRNLQRLIQMLCVPVAFVEPDKWSRIDLVKEVGKMEALERYHPIFSVEMENWLTHFVQRNLRVEGKPSSYEKELRKTERQERKKRASRLRKSKGSCGQFF